MRGTYSMASMLKISGVGQGPRGGGRGGPGGPGGRGRRPDLGAAAAKLGISEEALMQALGPPPPDLAAAAGKLGVTEPALKAALGVP
jgi:hypothetical protein